MGDDDGGDYADTLEECGIKMLEKTSALEHEQWIQWSKQIAATETISPDRLARWKTLWIPYEELTEEQKEQDRVWARKAIQIFNEYSEYI
jgi:hypothetical protein